MSQWSTDKAQEDYERGQKDGSQADFMDRVSHSLVKGYEPDAYNKGYDNGVANPPKDK